MIGSFAGNLQGDHILVVGGWIFFCFFWPTQAPKIHHFWSQNTPKSFGASHRCKSEKFKFDMKFWSQKSQDIRNFIIYTPKIGIFSHFSGRRGRLMKTIIHSFKVISTLTRLGFLGSFFFFFLLFQRGGRIPCWIFTGWPRAGSACVGWSSWPPHSRRGSSGNWQFGIPTNENIIFMQKCNYEHFGLQINQLVSPFPCFSSLILLSFPVGLPHQCQSNPAQVANCMGFFGGNWRCHNASSHRCCFWRIIPFRYSLIFRKLFRVSFARTSVSANDC